MVVSQLHKGACFAGALSVWLAHLLLHHDMQARIQQEAQEKPEAERLEIAAKERAKAEEEALADADYAKNAV